MKSDQESQATPAQGEEDTASEEAQPLWTVLSESETKSLLITASFAAIISPLSTSTYYPSVVAISKDLNVTTAMINLTISTYQVGSLVQKSPLTIRCGTNAGARTR